MVCPHKARRDSKSRRRTKNTIRVVNLLRIVFLVRRVLWAGMDTLSAGNSLINLVLGADSLILETNLASRWWGVRPPRASGKSPDFPGSFRRLPRNFSHLERCKGHTHKGHREKSTECQEFQDFSGCFQGVFREFQGIFRVFSGCFSLCPFRVCPLDPLNSLWNLTAIQRFPGSFPNFPGSSPNFPGSSGTSPEVSPFLWEAWHPLLTHKNFLW